jgi:hypothetical protein
MLSVRFDRASPTFSALEKTCKLEDIAQVCRYQLRYGYRSLVMDTFRSLNLRVP